MRHRGFAFSVGVVAVSILGCLSPFSAAAHPVRTVEGHAAEDSVALSAAKEKRLAVRTQAASGADADRQRPRLPATRAKSGSGARSSIGRS